MTRVQESKHQKTGFCPFKHDSESYGDPEKSWVDMAGRHIMFFFFFCTIARSLTRVPFVKKSSHCGSPIHSFVLVETTNSFLDFSTNLQSILALDVLLSRIQSFFYIRFIPIFTIPSKESNFQGLSEAYPQMALRYSEKW